MKTNYFNAIISILLVLSIMSNNGYAQIKIGDNPTAIGSSSLLELESDSKGMVLPRMTGAQMNAISNPMNGMVIYNTDSSCICQYAGGSWFSFCGKGINGKPNFWDLNGNANTADGVNFLGTTDNNVMNFRVNNQKAGRIDHVLYNAFYGYRSGENNTTGYRNTFIGDSAGFSNIDAYKSTAIGAKAMKSVTTGYYNTVVGYNAMANSTLGADNAAFGTGALYSGAGANGWNNVSVGNWTMMSNLSGHDNTAVGYNALPVNTSGLKNTAIGYTSMYQNTTGNGNTALGNQSLYGNTTGSNNIGIGNFTGAFSSTGSYNIFIGDGANAGNSNLTNATAIGKGANVGASNSLILGGTGADAVNVGIGNSIPTSTLQVSGSMAAAISNKTASYTLTGSDYCIYFTGAAASQMLTLPSANTCPGRMYVLINHATVSVDISPVTSGSSSTMTTIPVDSSIQVISDGTTWRKMN